jgi:hypothetical protein
VAAAKQTLSVSSIENTFIKEQTYRKQSTKQQVLLLQNLKKKREKGNCKLNLDSKISSEGPNGGIMSSGEFTRGAGGSIDESRCEPSGGVEEAPLVGLERGGVEDALQRKSDGNGGIGHGESRLEKVIEGGCRRRGSNGEVSDGRNASSLWGRGRSHFTPFGIWRFERPSGNNSDSSE